MELLEQELNDPSSPRPPPLPPRPSASRDPHQMTIPSMHSASSAPSVMTHTGNAVTSRSLSNQSVTSSGEVRDVTAHEERYVSSPQVQRPHKSATSVARLLQISSRHRTTDRSRTCDESSLMDTPPALPQPRKFSLTFDLFGESPCPEAGRSRSPGRPLQQQQLWGVRQHRDLPDPPSTPPGSADRSPRSSPHAKHP